MKNKSTEEEIMFSELGGLFGWLIVISFGGTLLNYIIKFVFKFSTEEKD